MDSEFEPCQRGAFMFHDGGTWGSTCFREAALVGEVSCVNEHVTFGQLERLVVCI